MQTNRSILCEKCQCAIDASDAPPSHTIEPRFLDNDYIPSESERIRLGSVLKAGEEELKRCEEDIAALWKALDRLEAEKKALEIMTSQCRVALSPHRRVPVEVWGTIFSTLCLSLHEYSYDANNWEFYDFPLSGFPTTILSNVCTHWRNIVVDMPSLWSSINVDFDVDHNIHTLLNVYLSRSNGLPLKLRIAFPPDPFPSWGFGVWEILSKNIWRSRELEIDSDDYSCIDDLPPIQHLSFPYLESFHEGAIVPDQETWPWFWQAIRGASNLVRFSTLSFEPQYSHVPFSQLTSWEALEAWDNQLEDFLKILQQCHCLRSLSLCLENYTNEFESSMVARDVKLPSLRRLSVDAHHNWLSGVFRSLDMPSLQVLNLGFRWPLPPSLLTMVRRSSPSLKEILLTDGTRSFGDEFPSSVPILFDVLQAASELTHFEFTSLSTVQDVDDNMFRVFHDMVSTLLSRLKDDSRDFLPKLSRLSLKVSSVMLNVQLVEQVLEVLEARHATSHPLTYFCLVRTFSGVKVNEQYAVEQESMIERMKFLASCGVEVVIQDCATDKP